jgi:hypothetical protein
MITTGTVVNNGEIGCAKWINSGDISGDSGRFCISGEFIHTGQIFGTVDICDATPGIPGDVMNGPVAASVTWCQAVPCSQCLLSSMDEHRNQSPVKIAPHPVNDVSVMEFSVDVNGNYQLLITDASGRLIKIQSFTGNQLYFDRAGMESGLYFYQVMDKNNTETAGKLIIE